MPGSNVNSLHHTFSEYTRAIVCYLPSHY